ncbi:hypothetical protein EDC15_11776 [Acetobacter aceti NBRC 14818]|nr:hypothetical protein EDC15_11776 [Acetobacter aceti NBRC 14818]
MQAGATRRTAARNFVDARGMTAQPAEEESCGTPLRQSRARRSRSSGRSAISRGHGVRRRQYCGRQVSPSCSVTGSWGVGRDRLLSREKPDHVRRWNDPPRRRNLPHSVRNGTRDGTLPISHTGNSLRSLHQSWLPFQADWVCADCCHRGKGVCTVQSRPHARNGN